MWVSSELGLAVILDLSAILWRGGFPSKGPANLRMARPERGIISGARRRTRTSIQAECLQVLISSSATYRVPNEIAVRRGETKGRAVQSLLTPLDTSANAQS